MDIISNNVTLKFVEFKDLSDGTIKYGYCLQLGAICKVFNDSFKSIDQLQNTINRDTVVAYIQDNEFYEIVLSTILDNNGMILNNEWVDYVLCTR